MSVMKVLIPVDDSTFSRAVVTEAAGRPWSPDTEFLVVSVIAIPTAAQWQDWGLSVVPELKERIKAEAQAVVDESVSTLKKHLDADVRGLVVEGHTADSIAKVAAEWKADMIMMGSHGRTGIGRFLLGSVAEGVLFRSPCSVEIIKPKMAKKASHHKAKAIVLY
jgi:nucleotide-binding universal stress UspA family protein